MIILLLAAVGAGVDAVLLVSFGVLTAAQTGNTILLGVALGQGRWQDGLGAGISVVGYVLGAAVGERIIESGGAGRGRPPRIASALVVELLLLIALLAAWRLIGVAAAEGLIALAALAMGIQSAATLRLHAGPMTTYVTGTLTTFVVQLMRRVSIEAGAADTRPWMYGLTWIAYLGGAIVTALLAFHFQQDAVVLPIAVLSVAVAVCVAAERRPRGNRPQR